MGKELLPAFILEHYEVHEWKHACAILRQDFPAEWSDLVAVLTEFRLRRSQIVEGGGSKSDVAKSIDQALYERGWQEKKFETQIVVDGSAVDSPTHSVDCFKNRAIKDTHDSGVWSTGASTASTPSRDVREVDSTAQGVSRDPAQR
jgi:hypothetical protein